METTFTVMFFLSIRLLNMVNEDYIQVTLKMTVCTYSLSDMKQNSHVMTWGGG